MRCRKCIVEFLPILLVTLLLALVDFHDTARGAEPEPALIVRNEGRETKRTLSALAKLSRVSVRATDEKGNEAVWEGTALHEVLKAAGVKLGEEATRGAALANYMMIEAADGYRVVFTLPEVDPAFTDLTFLLADSPQSAANG